MADDAVNIKNAPTRTLTHVVGHDADGKGGRQTVGDLMAFGTVGGAVGPVISLGKVVYGNNEGGEYSPVAYNEDPSPFALVMRDFTGNFTVNDPTEGGHPVSLAYFTWGNLQSKPAVIAAGANEDEARQAIGLTLPQPAIADLAAPPTDQDFNALLAALRAAGILAS